MDKMDELTGLMVPIDELTGQTKNFAVECYENKTMEELQKPHSPDEADPEECKLWRVSPRHWSLAMDAALKCRMMAADEKK
ncbi:MAG: hypothetical protein L0H63_05900 [Nitrococcus sp.]|nr:hypothetical protein [Nitrococcus sp.]